MSEKRQVQSQRPQQSCAGVGGAVTDHHNINIDSYFRDVEDDSQVARVKLRSSVDISHSSDLE